MWVSATYILVRWNTNLKCWRLIQVIYIFRLPCWDARRDTSYTSSLSQGEGCFMVYVNPQAMPLSFAFFNCVLIQALVFEICTRVMYPLWKKSVVGRYWSVVKQREVHWRVKASSWVMRYYSSSNSFIALLWWLASWLHKVDLLFCLHDSVWSFWMTSISCLCLCMSEQILHISDIEIKETKLLGNSPIIIINVSIYSHDLNWYSQYMICDRRCVRLWVY